MHIAQTVVVGQVLLYDSRRARIVNNHMLPTVARNDQLDGVEQLTGIAAAYTHKSLALFHLHLTPLRGIMLHSHVDKGLHLVLAKLFEHKHLAA